MGRVIQNAAMLLQLSLRVGLVLVVLGAGMVLGGAWAQPASAIPAPPPDSTVSPSAAAAASAPRGIQGVDPTPLRRPVPLVTDRIRPADMGLVINTQDPYSVAVGAYYAERRGLAEQQILRVKLPVQARLSPEELATLKKNIDDHFGFRAQALALAWVAPYAVNCNSLNGALAMGYDASLCENTCKPSRASPYANARTGRPFSSLRFRPSMHLAAPTLDQAKALIDRGLKADGSLAGVEGVAADALLLYTDDRARSVRSMLYPPDGTVLLNRVALRQVQGLQNAKSERLLALTVGAASWERLPELAWLPGALADHLTSFGGDLLGEHGQAKAWDWITAGATASHGAVSEPCNHLQKFPNPVWLLGHYAQGSTAIEAYWKSVPWPQQSVFIGDPLAAPFARMPSAGHAAD